MPAGRAWDGPPSGPVSPSTGSAYAGRVQALAVLAPTDEPTAHGFRLLTAPGVTVDDDTRRAATVHARPGGSRPSTSCPATCRPSA